MLLLSLKFFIAQTHYLNDNIFKVKYLFMNVYYEQCQGMCGEIS